MVGIGHSGDARFHMQDGRNRYYLCTALHDTPVPFEKALGLRLGLKKGELRLAPPEAMSDILAVAPGAATPLATLAASARRVVLLLDTRLRDAPFAVHPMTNAKTICVTADALETYLTARGRTPHWADLSVTDFKIGPGCPPELKAAADSVPEERGQKGRSVGVAAGTDSKKEKKAARCAPSVYT